jgi:Protein of unknown function (DUF559)
MRRTNIPSELRARPFHRDEALRLGLTRTVLEGRRFRRLHRLVYVCADVALTIRVRVLAALLVLPAGTAATGVTALRVYGLDVGRDRRLHFTTTRPHQRRIEGVVVHRRLRAALRRMWEGIPVTTPEQTFVEASRQLSLVDRVIAGDWLIHHGVTTLGDLQRFVDTVHDHGVKRARRAMEWVRERVESPRETLLRLMLIFARLPEPNLNVPLGDENEAIGRPDLVYFRYRVIIEYDGLYHLESRAQQNRDLARRESLEALGWRVIVVTAEGMRQPHEVVWRVYRALRDRGYDGQPPVFNDMWNFWFAGRTASERQAA